LWNIKMRGSIRSITINFTKLTKRSKRRLHYQVDDTQKYCERVHFGLDDLLQLMSELMKQLDLGIAPVYWCRLYMFSNVIITQYIYNILICIRTLQNVQKMTCYKTSE
jgi:hypothetical protein